MLFIVTVAPSITHSSILTDESGHHSQVSRESPCPQTLPCCGLNCRWPDTDLLPHEASSIYPTDGIAHSLLRMAVFIWKWILVPFTDDKCPLGHIIACLAIHLLSGLGFESSFKFFIFLIWRVWLFSLNMCLCSTCVQCPWRPEKDIRIRELEWQMVLGIKPECLKNSQYY